MGWTPKDKKRLKRVMPPVATPDELTGTNDSWVAPPHPHHPLAPGWPGEKYPWWSNAS